MKKSKLLMIVGPLLMLGLFVFPLWNITLEAPQYPIPLGMNIHINKFSDVHEFDIKNINLMNHYVGMQYIPESIPEFTIFPIVIISMVVIGVLIGFFAKPNWYLVWFVLMCLLGAAGIYDFYLWEYDYGHNLDPKAIMSFKNPDGSPMGFQPPLLGTKHILNFVAHSYPRAGAYFMFAGMLMTLGAFLLAKRELKMGKALLVAIIAFSMTACEVKPEPINFGSDACHFCQMTIVDQQHAAQYITQKGRQYKFDAVECMLNELSDSGLENKQLLLVSDFDQPGQMTEASGATYLISEGIKSPMGANLSSFAQEYGAAQQQKQHSGQLYIWKEMLKKYEIE